MTDRPKRPRDANHLAKFIVDVATGEREDAVQKKAEAQRRGGILGGQARAKKLSSDQRRKIAKAAAQARWQDGDDTSSS